MRAKQITGLAFLVLSIIGVFYSVLTYLNDTSSWYGYNYQPPLTSHETTVLVIGAVSVVGVIAGIKLLCSSKETASSTMPKWICSNCGKSNEDFFRKCTHCGTDRNHVQETEESWVCLFCGRRNRSSKDTCQCGGSKEWSQMKKKNR